MSAGIGTGGGGRVADIPGDDARCGAGGRSGCGGR